MVHRILLALLGFGLLAGCFAHQAEAPAPIAAKPVTRADGTVVTPVAQVAAEMRMIDLARLQVDVPRGTQIGKFSMPPLIYCWGTRLIDTHYQGERGEARSVAWTDAFRQVMKGHGYRVPGASGALFKEGREEAPEFEFGANVTSFYSEGMMSCDLITAEIKGLTGSAKITMEWQIFDPLRRRVLFRDTVEGTYASDRVLPVDSELMLHHAFADAVNKLAADPRVREIATAKPAATTTASAGPASDKSERPTPNRVLLPRQPQFTGSIDTHIDQLRAATVLIERSRTHGSGFIVRDDGLVVTNHHVVGGERFVRVRLISGRTVVGEVLTRDELRDVALVKLEGFGYPVLPIRETPVRVTEEVFAIGAPRDTQLGWTVTRGAVSAYRQAEPPEMLDLIQSDVAIHGGNSGGPLVDRHGNIVAICVAGIDPSGKKSTAGLNFFIPVLEGVQKLGLELVDPAEYRKSRRTAAN